MSSVKISLVVLCACVALSPAGVMAQGPDPFADPVTPGEGNPFELPAPPKSGGSAKSTPDQAAPEKPREETQIQREREKQAQITQRIAEQKKQIEEVLQKLKEHLPARLQDDVAQRLLEMAEQQVALERQVLNEQLQQQEMQARYEDLREKLNSEINQLLKERHQSDEQIDAIRQQSAGVDSALLEIQKWFAHALQAIDQPQLQNWVLAHLKAAPDVTRRLIELPAARGRGDDLVQQLLTESTQLELALRDLVKKETSDLGKTALEIIRLLAPNEFRNHNRPAVSTSRWPIVVEPGREREQEILNRLDERNEFVFYETPLKDVCQFLQDLYEIPIVLDASVSKQHPDLHEVLIDLQVEDLSLRAALEKGLQTHELTFQVRDEALMITPLEYARTHPLRRVYDVTRVDEQTNGDDLVVTLKEALDSRDLKIIRAGSRLVVVGSEQEHFELSKLLTLLALAE